jgi:hypothetical protein
MKNKSGQKVFRQFNIISIISLVFLCVVSLSSCVGMILVEKGGQALDGSAFTDKKLASYRRQGIEVRQVRAKADKGKEDIFLIKLDDFPSVQLRTAPPEKNGAFFFSSLYFLGGSLSGWNVFSQELSGSGSLRVVGNTAYLNVSGGLETGSITGGRISHNGSKLSGKEALSGLRSRYERIAVLVAWMKAAGARAAGSAPPVAPGAETPVKAGNTQKAKPPAHFADQEAFEDYWKPILLPERVGKKKRPAAYMDTGEWVTAEDVKWNTAYTRAVFPEDLWPLRDSGALLRDWEEAAGWIYFMYEWEYIEASVKEASLIR